MVSGPTNKDLISKLQIGLSSHQSGLTNWSTHDDRTSPSSVTSVTTDLVLGTVNEPSCAEELSCRSPSKQLNVVREHQTPLSPKPCLSSSNMSQKLDTSNLKAFYNSLLEKVGRQDAAVFAVSRAIIRCRGQERRRGASLRGDIWLSFIGQDMLAKKKAAKALAELISGSKENMICIDLGCQDSITSRNSIFYRNEVSKSDVSLRGKTVDDRIAGQISKKPSSVVFLENVEKADIVLQEKLKQAIWTGKISDSHGREFSINNAIFVVTTSKIGGKPSSPSREIVNFSEEKILAAQRWQMKMSVEPISKMTSKRPNLNASFSWRQECEKIQAASKRKLEISDCQRDQQQCSESPKRAHRISNAILDLNLPVEEEEVENDADCSSSSNSSDNEDPWLDEFLKLIDETVSFEPFNFDPLSEYIMREINKRFCSTIGSECLMEIDKRAMEEILAASLLLEDPKGLNNWIENVLVKGFVELRRRHNNKLSTHSTVRLVAMEETFAEVHAHGVLLPSRIILD
ncbi:uncharacterized protein A4U43_C08F34230 [Asparagus officinalis]|nr:uncharacterized protein A4U43_C08F34230 [Asparagus officinalis]